jgi:hypothetical protein
MNVYIYIVYESYFKNCIVTTCFDHHMVIISCFDSMETP